MEIYVFGSLTSGDVDAGSDADVLVLLERDDSPQVFPESWSVYSAGRIRKLYRKGTLFAWHLHQDAVRVWPRGSGGLLTSLGEPSHYRHAEYEIRGLLSVALDAAGELIRGTPSPVFELGLLFLATRDVAMAAAPRLLGRFVFSRYAPFEYTDPHFPLSHAEYFYLMGCRRASTRGSKMVSDEHARSAILKKLDDVVRWLLQLQRRVSYG